MADLDYRQLMMMSLAQQGMQGLGESFIRGDALRRGAPVPKSSQHDPAAQMMQFAQMQRQEKQREDAKAAIGQLKTIPDDVKTLMSLYPEESIKPYIQGQLRPDRQQQDIWSSPAGLYSRSAGGIIPGTGPPAKEPGAPTVKEFDVGDRKEMRQWNGQSWELIPGASAPRWQPDKPGGSGGAGAELAPYLGMMENQIVDPDTGELVTQKQFYGATRQKGVMPSPQAIGQPIETGRESSLTSKQKDQASSLDKQSSAMDSILGDLKAGPDAFNPTKGAAVSAAGALGETARAITERRLFTPEQIERRSALLNQVSAIIHERTGAAQTESERRTLGKFLPGEADSPEQITAKVKGFKGWLEQQRGAINPVRQSRQPAKQAAPPAPAPAPAAPKGKGPVQNVKTKADFDSLPSGTEFIAPDGSRRRKP